MNHIRLAALGATALLTLAACSKSDDAVEVAVKETGNTLFAYVPADTPYLAGNLQPPSDPRPTKSSIRFCTEFSRYSTRFRPNCARP